MTFSPLPAHWKSQPLAMCSAIDYGVMGAIDRSRKKGVPLISTANLTCSGRLNLEDHAFIDPDKVNPSQLLRIGDLLFIWRNGSRRHLGKTAVFRRSGKWTYVSFLFRIRAGRNLNNLFLYHYLRLIKERELFPGVRGNATFALNKRALGNLKIPIPPMREQERIVWILEWIETAIAQAEKAMTLARDHFHALIDYFYIGENPYPGLNHRRQTAPLHARVSLIKDLFNPRENPPIPMLGFEHVERGTGQLLGVGSTKGQRFKKWLFKPGDVLFGSLRPQMRRYHLAKEGGACSVEFMVLRANQGLCDPYYLLGLIQTPAFLERANVTTGSAIPRAKWDVIQTLTMAWPSLEEQRAIGGMLKTVMTVIEAYGVRLENLQALSSQMRHILLTGTRLTREDDP